MPREDHRVTKEHLRREYTRATLDESSVDPDPVRQFGRWLDEARKAGLAEPNAMTLATVSAEGWPSARIVLLKGFGEDGFVFFTDYRSRKAMDLAANPRACLLAFWVELERQVRITGAVESVPRAESEAYFLSRPLGSQLGAWASRQSAVLPEGRAELERRLEEVSARFAGAPVPAPPYWGGYRVLPSEFEFWQGRESRLHDRVRYTWRREAGWVVDRLSP
jgi:pyridoxamine 5'-phosphate oxidase